MRTKSDSVLSGGVNGERRRDSSRYIACAAALLLYTMLFLALELFGLAKLLQPMQANQRMLAWQMLCLTTLGGAAGGTLHGLASLSAHVGRGTFDPRWGLFYLARPFLGAGMSVFMWLILGSGIGGFEVKGDLALLAWGSLAGLFSQPALDKLRDLFATLFRTDSILQERRNENGKVIALQPPSPGARRGNHPQEADAERG